MNKRSSQRLLCARRFVSLTTAATLLGMAGIASAVQYQWRDDRGRMVYSDQPPPASVAPTRIIKAPVAAPTAAPAAAPADATVPATAAHGMPPAVVSGAAISNPPAATMADQELAFRKRIAEKAEAEKKAAEAAQSELKLARACADAKGDIRSLESGQRISRINEAGEREFLTEDDRRKRLRDARASVSERC